MTATLGLSAFGRDAAAALVVDGEAIAAAAEERFTRIPHDPAFPRRAIRSVLARGGLAARDLDHVVFHDKPLRVFERVLACQLRAFPRSAGTFARSAFLWLGERLWIKGRIAADLGVPPDRVLFCGHHRSHAAAAYLPAPFDEAAVLVADGAGEWAATSLWHGRDGQLAPLAEIPFPHSLSLVCSAVAQFLGLPPGEGEARVAELAALGEAGRASWLRERLQLRDDGSYLIDQRPFRFAHDGERLFSPRLAAALGPARAPGAPLRAAAPDTRDADVAAAVQALVEDALLHVAAELHRRVGGETLCFAGELAQNARACARLLRDGPFRRLWIPPAPGDDGCALGAALHVDALARGRRPARAGRAAPFLGEEPDAAGEEVGTALGGEEAVVAALLAHLLGEGLVGWVRGRFEFGPCALGRRSLLADPRGTAAGARVNAHVKRRETFRPFAAVVLAERADLLCELPAGADDALRWMQLAVPARPWLRERAPSLVHADGTCRPRLVHADEDPALHALLVRWEQATGVPALLHSSLDLRGDPPVRGAADARALFERSSLPALVVGDRLLVRAAAR